MKQALHDMTVAELAQGLAQNHFSAVEVTQHFLQRMAQDRSGSFLDQDPDAALAQARRADARRAAGLPRAGRRHRHAGPAPGRRPEACSTDKGHPAARANHEEPLPMAEWAPRPASARHRARCRCSSRPRPTGR